MGKRIGIDCRMWKETGVGRYIRNLVRIIESKDSDNHYFLFTTPESYDDVMSCITKKNFTVVSIAIHWHSVAEQILLPVKLLDYHLDVMHFPYFSFPILYPRPFITTIHDMTPWAYATGKASTLPAPLYWAKQGAYRLQQWIGVRRAKKIIAVTQATKQDIMKYLGVDEQKIVVTYEGVDGSITLRRNSLKKGSILRTLSLNPQKYFIAVGNFYPHKNLDRLVSAFTKVRTLRKDIQLVLVGKKDYFGERLYQHVRLQGLQGIVFAGFVSDDDLADLYQQSLATVYPSLTEGFGLPALEALANDSVVVASKIPAIEETCGDSVVYCDPYSEQDMARALEDVLNLSAKEKQELLSEGKKRLRKFSWTKMGEETLAVYTSVL